MGRDAFDVALIPGMRERLKEAYARFRATLAEFQQAESGVARNVTVRTHCPACGASASGAHSLFVSRQMEHVRCAACAQVYTREVLPDEDDRALYQGNSAMQGYLALKENPDFAWLEATKAAYVAGLARERCTGGNFLDVGCSTGKLLEAARACGFDVYGLEANPDMISRARAVFGSRVAEGYFPGAIPEGWPTFDVIAILDLLEHMVVPGDFLSQLSARLNPGGLLLVQVPNFDSLVVQLEGAASAVYCHGHWLHFTAPTLARLLDTAGFTELHRETVISELDRIRAFPAGEIEATLARLAPALAPRARTLTADDVHGHLLGFKLVGVFRKREGRQP